MGDLEKLKHERDHFKRAVLDRSIQDQIRLSLFYINQSLELVSRQMEMLRASLAEYQTNAMDLPKLEGENLVENGEQWR